MTSTTVRELLQHFKDDPKLQPLFSQLDELSKRVEVANAQNIVDPRIRSQPSRASRSGTSTLHANLSAGRVKHPTSGPSDGSVKVEEGCLPIPPLDVSTHLPSPPGSHPWEALQAPVNAACNQFGSPAAKATWKQWALTPDNVAVVVAVSWWTVAHVFQPDHHMAPAVKEHAFTFFARRYALDVLTYGGAGKDLYHNLWQSVVSSAAVEVLRGAFPRSAHKLDAQLEEFVRGQLVRWTVGVLPADLHPSDHELVGRGQPAAHTHFHRHVQHSSHDLPGSATSSSRTGTAGGLKSALSAPYSGIGTWAASSDDAHVNIAAVVAGAVAGPTVTHLSPKRHPALSSDPGPYTSQQFTSQPHTSSFIEPPPGLAAVRQHLDDMTSISPDSYNNNAAPSTSNSFTRPTVFADSQQQLTSPISASSPFSPYSDPFGALHTLNTEEPINSPTRHMDATSGGLTAGPGSTSPHSPTTEPLSSPNSQLAAVATGFVPQQASPVMAHMFESHALGLPRKQEAAHPGVMAHTFGVGQRSRRRPLDGAAPLAPQSSAGSAVIPSNEEEFTYAVLAKQSCQRAADAVAKYEACKAGARREVAALRRRWLTGRDALQARAADLCGGGAVKDMSDKLSNWLENDIDRMLRDQPVATVHVLRPSSLDGKTTSLTASDHALKKAALTDASQHKFGTRQTATEAVLQAGGGASAGAVTLGSVDRGGRQPGYLNMTAATVAGAGCASASFLAATAATAGSGAPSLTRIMQPWAKMRSLETQIRSTLSQARHGSNDMAAHLAVVAKEKDARNQMPGMRGNGQRGASWRPAPVEYTRGTLDIRLRHHVQKALKGVDMELYTEL